mgnify:CR=1 FL=1
MAILYSLFPITTVLSSFSVISCAIKACINGAAANGDDEMLTMIAEIIVNQRKLFQEQNIKDTLKDKVTDKIYSVIKAESKLDVEGLIQEAFLKIEKYVL